MTVIKSIDVAGLAGREDELVLELDPKLNVFFGLNGTGKSSLLKLMVSAAADDVSTIRRVPFRSANVTFTVEGQPEEIARSMDIQRLQSIPVSQPTTQIMGPAGPISIPYFMPQQGWSRSGGQPGPFPISYLSTLRQLGDAQGYGMTFSIAGEPSPYSEAKLDQLFFQQVMNRWNQYSNELLREIRELQEAGTAEVLDSLFRVTPKSIESLLDADTAFASVRHFLERRNMIMPASKPEFSDRYQEDEKLQAAVSDIDAVERQIAQAETPRNALENLVNKFYSSSKSIDFSSSHLQVKVGKDQYIGIDVLSSGEKQLLRLLIECLGAQGDCIVIDEPELSLHIDWQHDLVEAMQTINPNLQIILATHSPEIMADVDNKYIFRL